MSTLKQNVFKIYQKKTEEKSELVHSSETDRVLCWTINTKIHSWDSKDTNYGNDIIICLFPSIY